MSSRKSAWAVPLGIMFGVAFGCVASKLLDHWPGHVMADGSDARKAAIEQAALFRNAAKLIGPSVVNITTYQHVRYQEGGGIGFNEWGMPFYKQPRLKEGERPRGLGSGFVFDAAKGYIMTNNHVVAEGDRWVVRLSDKRELKATLVGTDPQTDIAVLKVEAANLTAAKLGNSAEIEVADMVLAVGNPFGFLEQTVTAGIISAKGRHGITGLNYEDLLQTDAAINQGNSGGPLVNVSGEVIGVNNCIISKSGGYQGIGFAIPINQAKRIAERLVKSGAVVRGWIGVKVQDLTADQAKRLSLDGGAAIDGIYLRSPAKLAGLEPGDVLIKFEGKPVHAARDISELVTDMEPGTKIKLTIRRKAETKTVDVTLATQPKDLDTSDNE
ncbi:MAG: trypsin-like peptidase domain-containing protein [Planctomycetota bacterium]